LDRGHPPAYPPAYPSHSCNGAGYQCVCVCGGGGGAGGGGGGAVRHRPQLVAGDIARAQFLGKPGALCVGRVPAAAIDDAQRCAGTVQHSESIGGSHHPHLFRNFIRVHNSECSVRGVQLIDFSVSWGFSALVLCQARCAVQAPSQATSQSLPINCTTHSNVMTSTQALYPSAVT
jgi:hypothetical protein